MRFKVPGENDDSNDWQQTEIKRLQRQVEQLQQDKATLQKKLDQKYFDEVYKENDRLKMELRNMEILLDENNDLKEELTKLKSLDYDDRTKLITEENQRLKRRNGELVIQVTDLEAKMRELKREQAVVPKSRQEGGMSGMFATTTGFFPRPQTAMHRSSKLDDLMPAKNEDLDAISTQLDRELEEMIAQNQRSMQEL